MSNSKLSRRLRYGGAAAALTAVIIACVILLNALFSALAGKFLWYTDLTSEGMYSLSDAAVDAIKDIDKDVSIIFCDDPDNLMSSTLQGYVYQTALGLEKANSHVHVENVNIWRNPSAVSYYKNNSKSNIYSTDIIITSGTEFRVYRLRSMFVFNDSDDTTPWSYNGEKKICSGILAVTRADSPICCITYNHGEPFVASSELASSNEILNLLYDAGYELKLIDLANEEIPEDCRMMLIYNPNSDFLVKDGISDKSEIEKLDKYLDGTNSMMVFVNPETPVLPNLEEYLEEWGITFDRTSTSPLSTGIAGKTVGCYVKDTMNSVTQDGLGIVGAYTSQGLGASLHSDLRTSYPPKVIFPNCMGISYASNYSKTPYEDQDDSSKNFVYYSYYSNGISRAIYDVFTSANTAVEIAGGKEIAKADDLNLFHLMTVTRESRMVDNTNEDYSYVVACGSTEFLSNPLLQSNTYGNTDVMLSALRAMGKELAIVDLKHKPFASTEIQNITTAEANGWTVALIIIPAILSLGIGIFVLVRRKYSR